MFCDAEGVSKEHIFAQSLTKLFTGHGLIRHAYEHPELGIPPKIKRAKTFAYQARKFCRDCNSGWMQRSDDAVRGLLRAFASDRATTLLPRGQERLAFWVTKVAFGCLSIEPEEYRFASPELYHELYRQQSPLPGSQVWLGANVHGHMGWARAHSLTFKDLPGRTNGFGASLSFGHAVFHLIYHGSEDHLLRLRMEPHQSLKQIWPTQKSVPWPPPLKMQPHDLTPLAVTIQANSNFVPVRDDDA